MALAEFGFPRNFYWDNGEDFKKVQRMLQGHDLGEQFGEALANLLRDNGATFGMTRALAYNAKTKPIESWFSTMSRRFDLIWDAAYQGRSAAHRSEHNAAAQKQHKSFELGKRVDSPLPADVEVIAGCVAWMQRENSRPRRVLGGETPFAILGEQCPVPLRPASRDLLNVLFSERDRRKVQRGGCVQLDRRRYEPIEASLGPLSIAQGRDVLVLRDPYALESAVALEPETLALVGELRLQEFVAQCPNGHITRDQIQAHARKVSHLRKMYSGYLSWLAAVGEAQGWKSEREVLLEEAGFATGTDGRALPPAAIPGAGARKALPAPPASAIFNDDAAARFSAAMEADAE